MALIRPVVMVYQEVATPTVTPTTPDLNCLIVGPAFHLRDYFKPGTAEYADKATIGLAATYGTLEAAPGTAPPVGPSILTVAEVPDNRPVAIVDAASVVVYFDEARVAIAEGTAGSTSASTPNTTATGPARRGRAQAPAARVSGIGHGGKADIEVASA